MKTPQITTAQQIKDILEPIPAELFQTDYFGHTQAPDAKNSGEIDNGCSCALGHIHRHFYPHDKEAVGDRCGFGARQLTNNYLSDKHRIFGASIVAVNNKQSINGYTEPEIKDRVMHLLDDMIRDGY